MYLFVIQMQSKKIQKKTLTYLPGFGLMVEWQYKFIRFPPHTIYMVPAIISGMILMLILTIKVG